MRLIYYHAKTPSLKYILVNFVYQKYYQLLDAKSTLQTASKAC